jgi:hypothetical protein
MAQAQNEKGLPHEKKPVSVSSASCKTLLVCSLELPEAFLERLMPAALGELIAAGFRHSPRLNDRVAKKSPVAIATSSLVEVNVANLSDRWIFHLHCILPGFNVLAALMALVGLQHLSPPRMLLIFDEAQCALGDAEITSGNAGFFLYTSGTPLRPLIQLQSGRPSARMPPPAIDWHPSSRGVQCRHAKATVLQKVAKIRR